MKFCTKCGEVYPSDVATCNVDGAVLEMWTRTLFEAKEDTNAGIIGRRSRHDDGDDEEGVTNVEAMPYDEPSVALTTKVSSSDIVNGDVSGSTSVIDMRDPVTLTEFDVNSRVAPVDTGSELVVYDDEVGGPFTGMLISNRYRLETRIGTGGFGVVFDAYDREADKRVAVKVLSAALSEDKRALMRFRREAIAVSRLEHPGIVSISDFGIEDEGVSYIVMEFLPGRDVAALLEDERFLSARRAATLVMQCAEALTAAHDEGVLHRDLKPANIFVIQTKDLVERIKIIDFGIAKDESSNPRMKDITAASKVVGTPFYMSPEQASGHELDGRADVYSLGVILYELLTGTRPFEGPSVYDILVAHGKAKRVRPSKVRAELREEGVLDDIVLKAIAAQREDRYQSMDAFAEALRGYLETGGGHASASSLRFDRALEGVRPSRGTMIESGQIKHHKPPPVVKTTPTWMIVVPLLLLIAAVAFLAMQSERDDSAGSSTTNGTGGQVAPVEQEPDPAPTKLKPVLYQVTRPAVKDAGLAEATATEDGGEEEAQPEMEIEEEPAPEAREPKRPRRPRRPKRPRAEDQTPKPDTKEPDPKPKPDVDSPIKERGIEEW